MIEIRTQYEFTQTGARLLIKLGVDKSAFVNAMLYRVNGGDVRRRWSFSESGLGDPFYLIEKLERSTIGLDGIEDKLDFLASNIRDQNEANGIEYFKLKYCLIDTPDERFNYRYSEGVWVRHS